MDEELRAIWSTKRGSTAERWLYAGKSLDSTTGFYYFGARYYLPSINRFVSEDPDAGSLSDPQSLNRYVYCRNNPHKYTDPDGKFPVWIAAGAIIGAAWNAFEYIYTHSGQEIDYRELAITMAAGAIEGAVTCAIGGIGVNFANEVAEKAALSGIEKGAVLAGSKYVSSVVGDVIGSFSSTAVEVVGESAIGNTDDLRGKIVDSCIAEPSIGIYTNAAAALLPDWVDPLMYLLPKIITTPVSTTSVDYNSWNYLEQYNTG